MKNSKIYFLSHIIFIILFFSLIYFLHANKAKTYTNGKFSKLSDFICPIIEYREHWIKTKKHDIRLLKKAIYKQFLNPDYLIRRNVVEALGELNEKNTLEFLWDIYQNDPILSVRHAAVTAICEYGDNHKEHKKETLKYILRILDTEPSDLIRLEALNGFSTLENPIYLDVLKEFFSKEEDDINQTYIACLMADWGDLSEIQYIKDMLLIEAETEKRKNASQIIGELNIDMMPTLNEAWDKEKDPYVRLELAAAFHKKGDPRGLPYLKGIISETKDLNLKLYTVRILCSINEQEFTYPFLLELLDKGDYITREMVIEDLVNFQTPDIEKILGKILLSDSSNIVREIDAWAFGERKDIKNLHYLEQALNDKDPFVRTGTCVAIYKILINK